MNVKLQRDLSGKSVLITDAATGAILRECAGEESRQIAKSYALAPMQRTFCEAEIDENGLLHLGDELEVNQ